MSALRKHGIGVPGQVAVTGFDDIPLARHLRTSLTTVRQPIKQLGTTAFDVLYSMLNREHLPARDIVLPTELIRRESCGCPAAGRPGRHRLVPGDMRNPMRMITRRIAFYLVTAVVAITVNFFIPRLMPGNPALAVLGRVQAQESKQAIAALELQYGVQTKTGLWGQYVQYWSHLLHGNLGTSLNFYPASVGGLIRAALPWTIALVGVATVISFVLGTLLGVAAAWQRGSWLDGLLPAMTFFQAAPYFFVAILAVALFATKLGWFPPNSGYDTTTLNPG